MFDKFFFCIVFLLAKPQLLFDADRNFQTIHIRLGENITMKCPYKNFDHFEWYKNTKPLDNNHMLHAELENVSFEDEGERNFVMISM